MADSNDLLDEAVARAVDLAQKASGEPRGIDRDLRTLSQTLEEWAAALGTERAQRSTPTRDTIETAVEAACSELARVGFM